MKPRNLPVADFKIKNWTARSGFLTECAKFVVLTPEEWVRQHFINYLIVNHNYPQIVISY